MVFYNYQHNKWENGAFGLRFFVFLFVVVGQKRVILFYVPIPPATNGVSRDI